MLAIAGTELLGRSILSNSSKTGKKINNATSKNIFNAKQANPADEDEYMKNYNREKSQKNIPVQPQKPNISENKPILRNVSTWNEDDLKSVMNSQDYQHDAFTQKKVKSYFEHKYPGKQRLDATGKQINN